MFAEKYFSEHEQFIQDNLVMECIVGSQAYGCNTVDSDFDFIGIVMDPHQQLYPQNYGHVLGFDKQPTFTSRECKGKDKRLLTESMKEVEGCWYSLTNFFQLAGLQGSPNLVELLFVRRPLVTYGTNIAWMLRDNRKLFLSMKSFSALKGYLNSQLIRVLKEAARWHKEGKCDNSTRRHFYESRGYDCKMAYHPLRLTDILHQMLTQDDIDLMRNNEECKRMRAGEWGTLKEFEDTVKRRLEALEILAMSPKNPLPTTPNKDALKKLLNSCVEEWYGSEGNKNKLTEEYISVKDVFNMQLELKKILSDQLKNQPHRPFMIATGSY